MIKLLVHALLLTVLLTAPATAQSLSDDFNDGVIDPSKWSVGSGFSHRAVDYNSVAVTASEPSGSLVFERLSPSPYPQFNAYTSLGVFDLRGRRSSAFLDASGGLNVYLAIGQDGQHLARIEAVAGYDGSFWAQCEYSNGNKYLNKICIQPADYSPQYLAIRVQSNSVIFESSADGVNWVALWIIHGAAFANGSQVEIGGGMYQPSGGVISGLIDNLTVN